MSDHRASSHADRRLLLVVIQGLDRTDLELGAALHLESLRDHTLGAAALDAPGAPPVVDQLLTALDVPALRSSGQSVCQRSVVLRPDWQDDRSSVDLLLRRVGGPADLTLLWLRDAAHAAVTGGRHCDGHRSALRRTDSLVREVHHALGQGARGVGVAVCGAAALAPVELSHDPRPLLRRALDRRDARRATVRVALSHAVLHCPSWPARQHAAARLRSDAERLIVIDAPAPDLAASLDLRPGDLLCVPPLGQAFATAPVRAAPRLLGDGVGPACALHPDLAETVTPTGLVQALLQGVAEPTPAAAAGRAVVTADTLGEAPDLLPGLRDAQDEPSADEFVYLDDEPGATGPPRS